MCVRIKLKCPTWNPLNVIFKRLEHVIFDIEDRVEN